MSTTVLWTLIALGLGIVIVQRRRMAIVLLCIQSMTLGVIAILDTVGSPSGLVIASLVLVARGVVLPALLWYVVSGTREPRRVAGERYALPRLLVALLATGLAVSLIPSFEFIASAEGRTAFALVVLGILIAAVRRPVVFQAIGLLVAENGVYLAGLSVAGGLPGIVEIALLFDLLLVLVVASAFGTKIHEEFGTSDTTVLRSLRD